MAPESLERPVPSQPFVATGRLPRVALCAAGEIWGGVEQFVITAARRLLELDAIAVVLLFHAGRLERSLRESGIVTIVLPYRKYDPRVVLHASHVLKSFDVDVLHVHGYRAAVLGGTAARLAGVRIVKTEHGRLEPWTGFGHLKMRINLALDRMLSRWLVDGVAFVSRDIAAESRSGGRAVRCVIHNGVPAQPRLAVASPSGVDAGAFNIGIIGRITPVKGHRCAIEAIRHLPHLHDVVLNIIGEGPLYDECIAVTASTALEGHVRFLGFREDVHECLASMQLVVMPSLHEGLPYVLLEAMAAGVPVVASAVGGIPEVIEDGVDGWLVPPGDAAQLAVAIETLHGDPLLRRRLGRNALAKVERIYSMNAVIDRYVDLYRATLRG